MADDKQVINLYLTIGLIGSGKSTWAKNKAEAEKRTIIINRDSFREMIKAKYVYDVELEGLVKSMARGALEKALINEFDIIIDETNITTKKRMEWINAAKFLKPNNVELNIIYVWCTETERNVELRMNDSRGMTREQWEGVFNSMKNAFENPDTEYESSIFNKLIKVAI